MPKKLKISILLSFVLLFLSTNAVFASLVVVDHSGQVVVNVLSDQIALGNSAKGNIEVKNAGGSNSGQDNIAVKKENGKIVLNIGDKKQLDVTTWQDNLVEIEERANVKKIDISLRDGQRVSKQRLYR